MQTILLTGAFTDGQSGSATLSDMTVSALEIFLDVAGTDSMDDVLADSRLRVILRDPVAPQEVLIPDLSLKLLSMVSDFKGGFGGEFTASGRDIRAIRVPLGSLHLKGSVKLEVEVLIAGDPATIQIAAGVDSMSTDHYFRYLLSPDLSDSYTHCNSLWLVPPVGARPTGTVQIRAGQQQYYTQTDALWARTVAVGQIEGIAGFGDFNLCQAFQALYGVPQTVFVNWSGANAGSSILQVEGRFNARRVRQSLAQDLSDVAGIMRTLESTAPEEAAAVVLSGIAAPSRQIAEAAEAVDTRDASTINWGGVIGGAARTSASK